MGRMGSTACGGIPARKPPPEQGLGAGYWCLVSPAGVRTASACRELDLRAQLVEQSFRVLQIGGVEAFGEPVVDFGEHRARIAALALLRE